MGTLLKQLEHDLLDARKTAKNGNANDKAKSKLINTVFSEAAMIGKNDGNRETDDNEVIELIEKFVKNNKSFIGDMYAQSKDGNLSSALEAKEKALRNEILILSAYLPKQLSEEELQHIIEAYISDDPDLNIGGVMQLLKANYKGQYDGKLASTMIRDALL